MSHSTECMRICTNKTIVTSQMNHHMIWIGVATKSRRTIGSSLSSLGALKKWKHLKRNHPNPRGSQSIKIDVGKSFDKSISIDKLIFNDIDFIGQSIKIDTHVPTKCWFYRFYRIHRSLLIDKNYPVSVEGALHCDSLKAGFKGGNEMICWQALHKRPKRLHYDFLPDFIVRLPGFDYKFPFPASRL